MVIEIILKVLSTCIYFLQYFINCKKHFILVGYSLLAINGDPITGRKYKDQDVLKEYLVNEENFPVNLKLVFNCIKFFNYYYY